jgi:hypothetical protein
MRSRFPWFLVGILALVPVHSARAHDFTFRVPVELHHLPAGVVRVMVSTVVYDGTWDQAHPSLGEHRIGFGESEVATIQDGEFSDTLTVQFSASPSFRRRPEEGVFYQVDMRLGTADGTGGACLTVMKSDGPYPYDPSRPLVCTYVGRLDQSTPVRIETRRRPSILPRIGR